MNKTFVTRLFCICLLAASAVCRAQEPDSIAVRELDDVVVTAQSARQRMARINLGSETLELVTLSKLPMLFGENDIINGV